MRLFIWDLRRIWVDGRISAAPRQAAPTGALAVGANVEENENVHTALQSHSSLVRVRYQSSPQQHRPRTIQSFTSDTHFCVGTQVGYRLLCIHTCQTPHHHQHYTIPQCCQCSYHHSGSFYMSTLTIVDRQCSVIRLHRVETMSNYVESCRT